MKYCEIRGCKYKARYASNLDDEPRTCLYHAYTLKHIYNVVTKKKVVRFCAGDGCTLYGTFKFQDLMYCKTHKPNGAEKLVVKIKVRKCKYNRCNKVFHTYDSKYCNKHRTPKCVVYNCTRTAMKDRLCGTHFLTYKILHPI